MARANKDPGRCKARTKTTNRRCKRAADDSGYCAQHRSDGQAREGSGSRRHGMYSKFFSAEEMEMLDQQEGRTQLDHEIRVAKIMLARAMKMWDEWAHNHDDVADLPIEETRQQDTMTAGEADSRLQEIKRRRPDLFAIIDRCNRTVATIVERQARVVEVRDLQEELEAMKGRLPQT